MDFDIFSRNCIDKVRNQTTLYYATSKTLVHLHYTWQIEETRKLHFSLKCCISALPEFNHSLLDFFFFISSIFVTHYSYSITPKSCNQCALLGAVGSGERKSRGAAADGLCYTHSAPVSCLLGFVFPKVLLQH